MSDQVKEPGWQTPEAEKSSPPASTNPEPTTAPPAEKPPRVRGPRRPKSPASNTSTPEGPTMTTSAESSPGGRRPPDPASSKVLTEIVASVLAGASSLVSLYTKGRFGISARLHDDEAKSIAAPIARIIQRQTNIRTDLNNAADGAGALAGALAYFERVAGEARTDNATSTTLPATRPSPEPVFATSTPAPRHERVESFVDQSNGPKLEPGSGDVRATFLSGFDEIPPR